MFDVRAADKVKMIISYEALPRNFELAKKNIEDNNITNSLFINTWVSSKWETIDLHYYEWVEWCNSIWSKWEWQKIYECPTQSIKEVFLWEPNFTKIKCDIEWMEYEIFTPDFEIPSTVSEVIMELHQPHLKCEAQVIFDTMEKQGFSKTICDCDDWTQEKAFICHFKR